MNNRHLDLSLHLILTACSLGCSSGTTDIRVTINAEPNVRLEADEIEFNVETQEGQTAIAERIDTTEQPYPFVRRIAPRGGDADRMVTVTVRAISSVTREVVVTWQRMVGFRAGQTVDLQVLLSDGCIGFDCSDEQTCEVQAGTPVCISINPLPDAGTDGGLDGPLPDSNVEACVPMCTGRSCGPNNCGSTCGECGDNMRCNESFACVPGQVVGPGAPQFSIVLGGSGGTSVTSAQQGASGNWYLAGNIEGTNNFASGIGGQDVFAASFTEAGALRWARVFGSPAEEWAYDMALDGQENMVVTGSFRETMVVGGETLTSAGDIDGYVFSIDSSGTVAWARRFGSAGLDAGASVTIDDQNRVFMVGFFSGTISFGNLTAVGGVDGIAAAWSQSGTTLWVTGVGAAQADGFAAADVSAGTLYAGGFTTGSTFGAPGAAGRNGLDAFLVSFNASTGARGFATAHGGMLNDDIKALTVEGDVVYAVGGFYGVLDSGVGLLISNGGQDMFMLTYRTDGSVRSAFRTGGPFDDYGSALAVSDDGAIFGACSQGGFDLGSGAAQTLGSLDGIAASVEIDGTVRWLTSLGGAGADCVNDIGFLPDGRVRVNGLYTGSGNLGGGVMLGTGYEGYLAVYPR